MSAQKPRIDVGSGSLALVIPFPSGVLITSQTGGTRCHHPEIEGVLFPLADDLKILQPQLEHHFSEVLNCACWFSITPEIADFVDDVLSRVVDCGIIRVDRSRLLESHEAWIHVDVTAPEDPNGPIRGFGPRFSAILTWPNSD